MSKRIKTIILILILLPFFLLSSCNKQGERGEKGDAGVSIIGVDKTATNGNVDIYTITFSNGTSTIFTVKNGVDGNKGDTGEKGISIVSVKKTDINDNVDTYTILFSDGTSTTFTVTNGEKGEQGIQGIQGDKGENGVSIISVEKTATNGNIDTYTISFSNNTKTTFTVTNGEKGEQGDQGIQGIQGEKGETGTSIVSIQKTSTEGNVDTYTILFSDGTSTTFTITNGEKGKDGAHANDEYTVTYNVDGGTLPENVEASLQVKYGDVLNLPIPTKEHYIFEGWYTGNTVNDGKFTSVTPVTKDITLIARWKADTTFNIYFNTNGGNGISPKTYYFDDEIYELPNASKYDSVFVGWYSDESLTTRVAYPLTLTDNLVVYAKYAPAYYNINFHTGTNVAVEPLSVEAGTSITTLSSPVIEGKEFKSWYYDSGLTKEVTYPFEIHSDLTLFAKYNDIYYLISFESNGGTYISSQNYQAGYYVNEFSAPTKTNYKFLGWYLDGALSNKVTYPYKVTDNKILYAKWQYVDPYSNYTKIYDEAGLQTITEMNGKYVLMNDIDCKGASLPIIGSNTNPFSGFFDGNGYTISNFSISSTTAAYVALFANNAGTIRNLNLEGIKVTGTVETNIYLSGLACINSGTIDGCRVEGEVNINRSYRYCDYLGGLVAVNNGRISNCSFSGLVNYTNLYLYTASAITRYQQGCNVGGIVASNQSTGIVEYCFVNGSIIHSFKATSSSYKYIFGGVIGNNAGKVNYCLSFAKVGTSEYSHFYKKPVVGYSESTGVVNSCYQAYDLTVSDGIVATLSELNSISFYTNKLKFDSSIWDLSNLDYENGLYVKLK